MAAAAGEYSGELPEPVTRLEYYLKKIKEAVENGSSVAPEDIDAAIEDYLNSHDADIVTEAELAETLEGKAAASHTHDDRYYTETEIDTLLGGKANSGHSHDDRYYTETEMDAALSGKANASHTHAQSDVTGLETALSGKANTSHTHDDRYYTEAEIDAALSGKSNSGHSHDDRYYTESEVDNLLGGKADAADIPDVSGFITRAVNDLVNYYTKSETYTQSEIDAMVSAIPKFAIEVVNSLPVQDISATTVYLLTVQNGEQGNLYDEYIHVGQNWEKLGTQTVDLSGYYTSAQVDALLSGLPVAGHTHDDRYYTEAEIDGRIQTLNTSIGGKADSGHLHDDRYYTEAEIDALLGGKANAGHSHDDRYYTEAETDALLGGKQNALTAGANITIETVNDALTISATDTTYPYKTNMIFDENYKTQFRTQTKGDAYAGGYISNIKVSGAGVDSAPQYGAGLAFGTSDTHGYINMNYSGDGFYVGGGSADKLNWTSRVYTTNYKPTKSDVGLGNVANLDQSGAIVNITRNGTVFTATKLDGTTFTFTQQDNNTTYSAATTSAAGLMSAADKTKLDGCRKIVVLSTQAAYEALNPPDADTVYLILEETT